MTKGVFALLLFIGSMLFIVGLGKIYLVARGKGHDRMSLLLSPVEFYEFCRRNTATTGKSAVLMLTGIVLTLLSLALLFLW